MIEQIKCWYDKHENTLDVCKLRQKTANAQFKARGRASMPQCYECLLGNRKPIIKKQPEMQCLRDGCNKTFLVDYNRKGGNEKKYCSKSCCNMASRKRMEAIK